MPPPEGYQDPRRRTPRHQTDTVSCALGKVQDLSAGGMCVHCNGKPPVSVGQTTSINLKCPEGVLKVSAQVVRVRKLGFRKHELGLRFVHLQDKMARALASLAEFGFLTGAPAGEEQTTQKPKSSRFRSPLLSASIDLPDYYGVLGVTYESTAEQIHEAFRALARKYHPDICKEPDSVDRFIKIQQAYEVLKDEKRRAMFDLQMAG